jgi:putative endonuclease
MFLKKLELSGFKSFVPILSKFQMFYFYILKSLASSKYYIGSSNNVEARIKLHNAGMVKSTQSDKPWKVIHNELFDTLADARARELQVKKWKSRKAIERLVLNI